MDWFLIITVAIIVYYGVMIKRHPHNWPSYVSLLPMIVFMAYARWFGMDEQAWVGAFQMAGLAALIVIAVLWRKSVIMDRITLGLNLFLIIGAAGFLFNIEQIIEWYSNSKGGPLFGAIAAIGVI